MSGMFGSTDSNTTQEWKPPEWTNDKWQEGVDRAYDISGVYGNGADLSWQGPFAMPATTEQVDAMSGLRGMALPMVGNPQYMQQQANAKNNTIQQGLTGGMTNPYQGASNPFGGASNPEFERMLASTRQGMEESFGRGTAANTNASAARDRAYGGSAHNELAAVQGGELAKQVAGMESGMRNDQYNRAAGLWGQDTGRNAGLAETGFGRQLQTLGMMPSLQAGDVNLLNSLLSGGELFRGLDQLELDKQIGRHQQNVMQPTAALNILMDALARASGGGGTASTITRGGGGLFR
jgi:hypothetical protein